MITNRSSFSGLYIARSGIVTAQGNLDVTGQNMTNINTEGYTRQRLDIRSVGDSGYKSKYSNQGVKIGYGVEATGIQQLRDASLDTRYRTEHAEYGYEDILVSGLNDLQGILDETINEGLQAQLSEVMTSFESLLADASGAEYINVVKNNIQLVNKLFNEISGNMETVFQQNVEDFKMEVDNINLILGKLAGLNDLIRTDKMVGNSALELMDERNLLLDELSGIMDIRYQVDPEDYESMSIYFLDSNGNKHILVDNEDYVELELRPSAEEIQRGTSISINVKNEQYVYTYAENGAILTQEESDHYIETVPATQSIYIFGDDAENGSLAAYFDLLNADGDPENRGIEYYMERLDTMANTFAQMVNDINRGGIFDKNGKLEITEDYLYDILANGEKLYTADGNVFDMSLLNEAVFGTEDIYPKYLMDENGVLLKDAAGNYISADEIGSYANAKTTRVYNNGKIYISEQQYDELGEAGTVTGVDGVQENYRIVTVEPINGLTEIPSQYVVDKNGEFITGADGNYILADSTKSPQVPTIYAWTDPNDANNVKYYTEEQKDKYLTANPRATEAEFVDVTTSMNISKMYESTADATLNVTKEVKFIGDSNGDLLRDAEGNYITTTDGTIPELYTGVTVTDGNGVVTTINELFTSREQIDRYVAANYANQTIDYGINHNNGGTISDDGNYQILQSINYISRMGQNTALKDVYGNYFVGVGGLLPTLYDGVVISDGATETTVTGLFSSQEQADKYVAENYPGRNIILYGADGNGNHGKVPHAYSCAIFEVMDESTPITVMETLTVQEKQYINENDYNGLSDDDKKLFKQFKEDVPPLYLYSTDKNLLMTNDNTEKITAGNITISTEWMKDDKVLLNSIKQFAATGDNDNIQRFITVFSDTLTFHSDKYGDMFKGTLQGCSSNIMTTVGLDINIHTSLATSYETNLNTINSNRMAVSSVDENEETANLMMYQKAFQASSRVMTTVDEMLDKLINATGMVGR